MTPWNRQFSPLQGHELNKRIQQAVGVLPNEKGGVTLITKKVSAFNKPNQSQTKTTFSGAKSSRK